MNTRHLVDPELIPGLEFFPPIDLTRIDLPKFRESMKKTLPALETYAREDVKIEQRMVPGLNGAPDVRTILYRPIGAQPQLPVLLSIHGGGYILGSAEGEGPKCVANASGLGCLVASVDYRLAPESRAPAQVEDCYAVLRWLHQNAAELGLDRSRFAIWGDSAGGGIAAALALMARDRGEVPLCFQVLIYPMLDDRTVMRQDVNPHVGEFIWTRQWNAYGWEALLGMKPGASEVSPYASAARARDLSGLPPVYISVGALDLFLDENLAYAERLLRAGVPTELHVFARAYHGFEVNLEAPLVREAERERRRALARAFKRG